MQLHGIDDIMHIVFGASGGALISEMTASQAMFQIVGAILENCPGKSAVTSVLEHPSAYDAVKYYCDKTGKEFRVAQANPKTGGIDVEEIRRVVSPDTCLLSIMYASNITGSIMDMAGIVKAAREINPDIYIGTDAVQHAPHAVLDVDALGVDGATFAPYKFFGTRGMGYGYVSDRVAKLPHRKVLQRPADVWELGSPTPGNFAAMSAVVDYVCWLGGHFIQSDDRRTLFVTGMEHIHLQERALLHTMLEGTQNVPGLRHIPGVHVYVDTEDLTHRDLIVAMGIDGLDMTRCVEEYQKRGVTTFERVNTSVYSKRIVGCDPRLAAALPHRRGHRDVSARHSGARAGICKVIILSPPFFFPYAQTLPHPRQGLLQFCHVCAILAAAISEGGGRHARIRNEKSARRES